MRDGTSNLRFATVCAIDTTFLARRLPESKQNYVSLQFWVIDTTFLARGLPESKQNLRLATVLGDRHHVFSEMVAASKMKFAFRYSFGQGLRARE